MLKWFNGKKTILGTVALMAGAVIDQLMIGIWNVDWSWLGQVGSSLDWTGLALGGVGLTHKGIKVRANGANS